MTILLVSAVRRHTLATEHSGYIYAIDFENRKVLRRCQMIEPAYRELDPNPRGGMRGGKGISVREDQIAVANSSMVFRYDPQWNPLGVITHPSCAAIHDIAFQGDALWVSSASNDLLLKFDLGGNLLRHDYLRDPSPAIDALDWRPLVLLKPEHIRAGSIDFRRPSQYDKVEYDNAHVNSMAILPNGDILVSLGFVIGSEFTWLLRWKLRLVRLGLWPAVLAANRYVRKNFRIGSKNTENTLAVRPAKARSAVVRMTSTGNRSLVLALPAMTTPSHSLLVLPDGTVIYLDTTNGAVIRFDPHAGRILSSTKVTDGFLRGVTILSDQILLLGSKGEILTFDISTQSLVGSMTITDDPLESIFDIKVLPPHYALPPVSFPEHLARTTGYDSAEAIIERGFKLQVATETRIP